MSDLIERQAEIDAILEQTVCATKRELVERCDTNISDENGWLGGVCIALDTIEDLPSAQPESIRCENCKHWTRTCGDEQWGLGDCDVFDKHLVMCNGYCAWAERREE